MSHPNRGVRLAIIYAKLELSKKLDWSYTFKSQKPVQVRPDWDDRTV